MEQRMEERTRERVRIARDLHDTLLQGIQGLVLRFHFATEQLPPEEPVRQMLRTALDRADEVINEGREKVRELRAESSERNLKEDLTSAAFALQDESNVQISVTVSGEARTLHPAVRDELYWIGREALINAVHHAHAGHIGLELAYEAEAFRLICDDNGRGIAPEILRDGATDGHWGMIGMRERAARMDGHLAVSSTPGAGTRIEVRIPERTAYTDRGGVLAIILRIFERLGKLWPHEMSADSVSGNATPTNAQAESSVPVHH